MFGVLGPPRKVLLVFEDIEPPLWYLFLSRSGCGGKGISYGVLMRGHAQVHYLEQLKVQSSVSTNAFTCQPTVEVESCSTLYTANATLFVSLSSCSWAVHDV